MSLFSPTATGARSSHTGASTRDVNIALWNPANRSADADIIHDARRLRGRARDLVRNHPYARQAVRASHLGVIGRKLRYACMPDHRFLGIDVEIAQRWATEFERVFENYAHGVGFYVDAGRRMTFTQLCRLAQISRFVDGEAFATLEWDDNRRWRTCVQPIDVDRLSNPNGQPDTAYLRAGVVLDDLSAPVGYHVRNGHESDVGVDAVRASSTWSLVRRETDWGRTIALHVYDVERPGQTRGVTALASVVKDMKMGREYVEATLASAILQSSYAAVLTSQQSYRDAMEVIAGLPPEQQGSVGKVIAEMATDHLEAVKVYHDDMQMRFNGRQVPVLYPNEKLELLTPGHKADSLADFQSASSRAYAAGTGTDPIAVSQDYTQVNYSSAKMAAATSWRQYEVQREDLMAGFAMPIVSAFIEECVFSGAIPLPKGISPLDFYDARDALVRGKFLTQGAPMLDPVKERQAQQSGLTLGVVTLQDIAAEDGEDYLEKLDQRARENMQLADRGLPPPGVPPMLMLQMQAQAEAPEESDTNEDATPTEPAVAP